MAKQTAVSGIQASGILHIGNYIGAIQQFVKLQDKYKMFVFIADLHAITAPQDPKILRENTLNVAALYLACGLDPKKTTLFVQSQIPAHTELSWILSTISPLGELERMTQFKDKSTRVLTTLGGGDATIKRIYRIPAESVNAGLLNYPVLMAADILLYRADFVPVGEDQLQHLELTRTLVRKFNSCFGKVFKEPKALVQKEGARIMGLDDPAVKMSKSAVRPDNYIGLLDSPAEIRRKIKIAVTDSGREIKYIEGTKPAVSNLLVIYSLMSGLSITALEKKYQNRGYAEFKKDLAELLVRKLAPLQEKYKSLSKNPKKIKKILSDGAKEANKIALKTMSEVRERIGLLSF